MKAVLDTSVLIGDAVPTGVEGSISVASISELHFGVLVAPTAEERSCRLQRLGSIEAAFDPLPITVEIARIWGRLASDVSLRGGNPRRRQVDLAIAATALAEGVPLLTFNLSDFTIIEDLVDARHP